MRIHLSSKVAPYVAVVLAAGFTLVATPPAVSAPVPDDTPDAADAEG